MASKGSKRKHIGKAIRHGYDRLKQAIQPSSQPSVRNSIGAGVRAADARSTSPAPSATPTGLAASRLAFPQDAGAIGQLPGPSTLDNSPALAPTTAAPASPGSTPAVQLKEVTSVAWSGLETALRVLEKGADVFPPLKSAVGALISCLDLVQVAAANRKYYEELTSELTTIADTLNQYLSELGSESTDGGAARITLSIEAEVAEIQKQQGRGKARRMIESTRDEDIIKRYRRIEGLFRQLQGDMVLRIWRNTNKQHATALLRGMSPVDDARYNSSYSTIIKRRGCTAETREKVQADLQEWVQDPNAAKVYWMNGMAGTGKTTIAYSLCEWLAANQRLGGSFFCSRGSPTCRDVHQLVPTIAYNLALYSATFRSALCKVLEEDPGASKLNVVLQFEKLVRGPMQDVGTSIPGDIVIVIDALDECEDVHGVRLILETLLRLAANLPLRFFVTSRPEPEIRDRMLSSGGCSPSVLHLHDIEKSIVEGDIKKYLIEALGFMSPPPTDEQVEKLAKRAGNLFIYAATVVRYILPGIGSANSVARLNAVLSTDSQLASRGHSNKKYKELDELYRTILAAAFNDTILEEGELEATRLVLRTAVCAKEPITASTMASLLELTEAQVSSALQPLRSVLHVSEPGGLVSTLHASFPDYMLDSFRSGNFYCDLAQHSDLLARRCFQVMKEQLRFNICGLESSFVFDKDVPDLEQRMRSRISPTLFYACQYWGEHLQSAGPSGVLRDKLADFLTHRLLFWMEVLNLKLCVLKGVTILIKAEKWLQASGPSTAAQKQAVDARDFVTRFAGGACVRSTPHIYLSALPFCARSSFVYACYWGRTRGLIEVRGTAISRRERAAQATWVTDAKIISLALSPDGTRIISGLGDGTIRVWDAHTGNPVVGPFVGHTNSVGSVALSPDGTRVVSGSYDRTIRVWDAHTGDPVAGPFEGHTSFVFSVAFSPDGTRIASGSDDETIRVWDSFTGNAVARPFEGHAGSVYSVIFSPDGTRIVSGSFDRTIRVWDAHTGNTVAGPFEGHTRSVNSVAFSPDGTRLVSGSSDRMIRVWDTHTGNPVAGPFEGHTDLVNSVAFSPDGTRIVSGSSDQTIRLWDAHTGASVARPLEGHTHSANCVAFSPDGTRIISGSTDRTIRVWDAHAGDALAIPFEGHTDSINSVAFSSDGTRIVSCSSDETIRMWDAHTGNAVAGPFEGHMDRVTSVALSPDGTRIVSGSDETILIWDVHSGRAVAGPLEGHAHWVNSVAFSPDGTRIVSGSTDQTVRVWDVHTGNAVAGPFEGHTRPVCSVAFSPDGTRIVSGSDDDTSRVWDAHTGNAVAEPFEGHTAPVYFVAFSPDGTHIISSSYDQTIVWDARTANAITAPVLLEGHMSPGYSVAVSPDGAQVVSGSEDGTIRVWDAHTGNVIAGPFEGHTGSVRSVAFSPDSTHIVSGSDDQIIRVWYPRISYAAAGSSEGHASPVNSVGSALDVIHTLFNTNPQDGSLPHVPRVQNSSLLQQNLVHDVMTNTRGFKTNTDGWVTTDNIPLFWVSPDFRSHVPHPRNTLVIGPQGTVFIDYQHLKLGEKWSECYILP